MIPYISNISYIRKCIGKIIYCSMLQYIYSNTLLNIFWFHKGSAWSVQLWHRHLSSTLFLQHNEQAQKFGTVTYLSSLPFFRETTEATSLSHLAPILIFSCKYPVSCPPSSCPAWNCPVSLRKPPLFLTSECISPLDHLQLFLQALEAVCMMTSADVQFHQTNCCCR